MSIKKIFKQQFQLRNFLLQHKVASDFYLSSFQSNRSTTPLLIVRTVICLGCLSIWITSMVPTLWYIPTNFWPIYMTHWGLIMNTIAAGFGLVISVMAAIKLPIDPNSVLPWYIRAYWVLVNLATPNALFITIFYWSLLTGIEHGLELNKTMDIFIHGVNSVLMCALFFSARHPTYFFHFYISIGFPLLYLIFSYVYFISGGTDPMGFHTIYPMLDWEKPGQTMVIAVLCMIGIIILQGVIVAVSAVRDALSGQFQKETTAYDVHKPY